MAIDLAGPAHDLADAGVGLSSETEGPAFPAEARLPRSSGAVGAYLAGAAGSMVADAVVDPGVFLLDLLDQWATGGSTERSRLALRLSGFGIEAPDLFLSEPVESALDTFARRNSGGPVLRDHRTELERAGLAHLMDQPLGGSLTLIRDFIVADLPRDRSAMPAPDAANGFISGETPSDLPDTPAARHAFADEVGGGGDLLDLVGALESWRDEAEQGLASVPQRLAAVDIHEPFDVLASPVASALDLLEARADAGSRFSEALRAVSAYVLAGPDQRVIIRQQMAHDRAFSTLIAILDVPLAQSLGIIKRLLADDIRDAAGEGEPPPNTELLEILNLLDSLIQRRPEARAALLNRLVAEGISNPDAFLARPLGEVAEFLMSRMEEGSPLRRILALLRRYPSAGTEEQAAIRAELEELGLFADPMALADMAMEDALGMLAVASMFQRLRLAAPAEAPSFAERLEKLLDLWRGSWPRSPERADVMARLRALIGLPDGPRTEIFVARALATPDAVTRLEDLLAKARADSRDLAVAKSQLDLDWGLRNPAALQAQLDAENFRRRLREFLRNWHADQPDASSRADYRRELKAAMRQEYGPVLDAGIFAERLGTRMDLHTFTLMFRSYLMSANPLRSFYALEFYRSWGIHDPQKLAQYFGIGLARPLPPPEPPRLIKYRMRPRKWKPGSYYGYDDGDVEVLGSEFL
jgi:hypothetical protein